MGLITAVILGGALLLVIVVGLWGGAKKRATGKRPADSAKAPGQPSADAPTPARSVIESPAQKEKAREHTPPA
ncbi:MAG: hypothetical protein ABI222_16325 [Opitutaceae bacterium]